MKTKLLYLLLFICSYSYAQVPSSGLVRAYDFTNGSLVDLINSENLTQTWASATLVNDRLATPNNAYGLNGSYFTANDIDYGGNDNLTNSNRDIYSTLSFWVKTSNNNGGIKTIIDESQRVNSSTANWYGYYIYLENGKINVDVRYQLQRVYPSTVYYNRTVTAQSTSNIADGNWHHVVVSIHAKQRYTTAYANDHKASVYIDDTLENTNTTNDFDYYAVLSKNHDTHITNFVIGNVFGGALSSTEIYTDEIDDVLVYDRLLTTAEINTLYTNTEICIPPSSSIISSSSVLETTATIDIAGTDTYDIAYHKTSEPFTNAIINTGITTGSLNIAMLDDFTSYYVYIRKHCVSTVSDWSDAFSFTTEKTYIEIYVDSNATGANDGTSWADAFTSLNDAIAVALDPTYQIWVVGGTYIPTAGTGRNAAFSIYKAIEIYGGFDGTETHVSQRDPLVNVTVLSGDLNGDDSATITDTETTRQDNSYHVIKLVGDFASGGVIDGFTISGGNANGATSASCTTASTSQYYHTRGGAIYANPNDENRQVNMKFSNCIIEKNSAIGMAVSYTFSPCGAQGTFSDIDFENSIVRDNYSIDYPAIFYGGSGTYNNNRNGSLINCLLYNNHTVNEASVLTISTSGGVTAAVVNVVNNTFTKNTSGVNKVIKLTNATSSYFRNSIVYDNDGNTSSIDISGTSPATSDLIIEGGQLGGANSDPLFTDAANGDFTLTATSPAIDSGNNYYVTTTLDLLGNQRVFNTTVDLGAYEFASTLSANNYELTNNEIKLYPNPTTSILNIDMVQNIQQATIFTVLGSQVLKTSSKTINTSNLKSGIYLIKIEDETGAIATKRFIKN